MMLKGTAAELFKKNQIETLLVGSMLQIHKSQMVPHVGHSVCV